jgi:hypothetical protein
MNARANCYETEKSWLFSRKPLGDYLTNYAISPHFPLAEAAAASAAVPDAIGPLRLDAARFRWQKFAIILFTLDVGVRRIQIGRDEWLQAAQTLRRWLIFWGGAPRPPKAEESLAALLARRRQVRSQHTAPALEPGPDFFHPERPAEMPLPGETVPAAPPAQAAPPPAESP